MRASVSPEAGAELIEAATHYARESDTQLGMDFIAEFERTLAVLCEHPEMGGTWRGATRRFPLHRFPYTVVYQFKAGTIRVIAVAHQSRRPGYWRGRE